MICYEGDFPEVWRIVAANKGADLVLHPTAYETPCEADGWWDKLYEASAMTNVRPGLPPQTWLDSPWMERRISLAEAV